MEIPPSYSNNKPNQSLPPRRGQITKKVLGTIFKSVVLAAGGCGKKRGENRRSPLSSASLTPHETPSGYNSDDQSDR